MGWYKSLFVFEMFSIFVLAILISPFVLAYDGFSDPISTFTFSNNLVSVSDSAVYKYGYYSIDGGAWTPFTLNGNVLGGNWLTGTATKTLPSFGVGEHYVVVYSCTRVSGAWNCHGNMWQIKMVNNEATPTCTLGTNTNCAYCGNVCPTDYACVTNQCAPISKGTGNIYYLSPSGSDTSGDGSISKPWFSLNQAWKVVAAGDTIYLRGGTYGINAEQRFSGKSGTADKMIRIWAYPGEKPIISPGSAFTGTVGIQLVGVNYLHLKGLEIAGFEQREGSNWYNGITAGNINYCIFEQLNVHHNGFGFSIGNWGSSSSTGNIVLNSDFHHNSDPLTAIEDNRPWGGSDGLTIRVSDPNAVNTISGCRMWWNSDDGLDLWANEGMIILNNSWAFWNGFQPGNFANAGDGNGFKLGPTYANGTPMKRKITNNMAFQNKLWGFVDNAAKCNMEIYNNMAYQNCYKNYETWCGGYYFHMVPGIPYYMKNNIAYNQAGGYNTLLHTLTNINYNSWDTSGISVSDADFVSVVPAGVDGPRKADGSLPDIDFLKLRSDSDLVNKGVNVGLPYSGSAPDLGPFEVGTSTACTPNCAGKQCGSDGCNGVCGTCTNSHGTTSCSSVGLCQPSCASGYATCDGNTANGCETNIFTSSSNCGSCGSTCSGTCNSGICTTSNPVTNTPKGSGTTYYVSTSGSDTNDGRSESAPWKTLSRVNEQTLNPGDTILFRRGDTWYGSLTVKASGSSGRPITFGSYGTASEKPTLSGFTTVTGWTNEGSGTYSKVVSSESNPNILYFNGKNSPMGRWPNTGWLIVDSHSGRTSITDSALSSSPYDWDGGEIVLRAHWWIITRNKITSHSGNNIYYTAAQDYYDAMDGNGYFIQNHRGTFDIVGDWSYDGSKLYVYFGSNTPSNYVVKFPSIDRFTHLLNKDYITFDNIHFTGYNGDVITINSSIYATVTNCVFDFIGDTAVYSPWQWYSDHPVVQYNTFDNINNDAIFFQGDTQYASIQYNTISNIGTISGLSGSVDGSGLAIQASADNSIIKYNSIANVGYNGISFNGANTVVSNNFINNFCMNKDDGAGIYTYEDEGSGKQITNNIVINGVGAADGTRLANEHRAHGIYIDGSDNILISGNSLAHNNGAGIFINTQALYMDIQSNTVFDNDEAGIMIQSNMRGGGEVHDLKMQNNIFVSEAGQDVLYYVTTSGDSAVRQLGVASTINNNYYARPIDDTATMRTEINAWSGPSTDRTLAGWQSYSGFDANSKKSPKTITNAADIRFEYNPTSSSKTVSLGGNYIDVKGTPYSSVTLQPFTSAILIKN